jgi:glutaredoxin
MIVLYSTHCPQCRALETKLQKANIEYVLNDNKEEMLKLGFKSAPILQVDGTYYNFAEAIGWVNSQK